MKSSLEETLPLADPDALAKLPLRSRSLPPNPPPTSPANSSSLTAAMRSKNTKARLGCTTEGKASLPRRKTICPNKRGQPFSGLRRHGPQTLQRSQERDQVSLFLRTELCAKDQVEVLNRVLQS